MSIIYMNDTIKKYLKPSSEITPNQIFLPVNKHIKYETSGIYTVIRQKLPSWFSACSKLMDEREVTDNFFLSIKDSKKNLTITNLSYNLNNKHRPEVNFLKYVEKILSNVKESDINVFIILNDAMNNLSSHTQHKIIEQTLMGRSKNFFIFS